MTVVVGVFMWVAVISLFMIMMVVVVSVMMLMAVIVLMAFDPGLAFAAAANGAHNRLLTEKC
jgi:hypothetical protein